MYAKVNGLEVVRLLLILYGTSVAETLLILPRCLRKRSEAVLLNSAVPRGILPPPPPANGKKSRHTPNPSCLCVFAKAVKLPFSLPENLKIVISKRYELFDRLGKRNFFGHITLPGICRLTSNAELNLMLLYCRLAAQFVVRRLKPRGEGDGHSLAALCVLSK